MTSILPQLSVRDGLAAVEFYKAAFGAIEVYRVGGTDDNPDLVAQLSVDNASFWVSDESPEHANFSPESVGGGTVRMLLLVDDPDSMIEQAVAAGATQVYPVGEEHGWRLGRIKDPLGPSPQTRCHREIALVSGIIFVGLLDNRHRLGK